MIYKNFETQASSLIEQNMLDYFFLVPQYTNSKCILVGSQILILDSGLKNASFNHIVSLNNHLQDSSIEQSINYFKLNNQKFTWWINQNTSKALTLKLNQFCINCFNDHGMALIIDNFKQINQNKLTIKLVDNIATMSDFALIQFDISAGDKEVEIYYNQINIDKLKSQGQLKFFVGYLNNIPVVTGQLFLNDKTAGIYSIATKSRFRNQGLATEMLSYLINFAQDLNYKIIILQASESGLNLYKKIGFKEYFIYNGFEF